MRNCSDKVTTICSKKVNAKCVKYTGLISEKSSLPIDSCNTSFESFEDIYTQLNELFSNLNFENLGNLCLQYEGENTSEHLSNILLKFEESICELKEIVSKKGLDLSALDTKCLKDACDTSPTELLDVLQLLIDRSCEDTSTNDICECCPKNVMYYENEGTPSSFAITDAAVEFISDFASIQGLNPLEFIATEPGRYKVRWTGELKVNDANISTINFNFPSIVTINSYKGVGTQVNNFTNSSLIENAGSRKNVMHTYNISSNSYRNIDDFGFEFTFEVLLEQGESVAVCAQEGSNVHYIGKNLFSVDKICNPIVT